MDTWLYLVHLQNVLVEICIFVGLVSGLGSARLCSIRGGSWAQCRVKLEILGFNVLFSRREKSAWEEM